MRSTLLEQLCKRSAFRSPNPAPPVPYQPPFFPAAILPLFHASRMLLYMKGANKQGFLPALTETGHQSIWSPAQQTELVVHDLTAVTTFSSFKKHARSITRKKIGVFRMVDLLETNGMSDSLALVLSASYLLFLRFLL